MVLLARGSVTVTAVNDGVPEKLYRAWSNNANGSGYSTTDSSGKYLGTYVGLSEPTLASQYKWTLIKGETGEPGQPGVSAYLHTAWANSANGQTGFSTSVSTDKLYIGTYSSSSPTPSQSYGSYKWVRVKGLDAKFYSVIVDKSFLNRNGLSSTATEKIAINSYVYEGNSAGVAAPGFFIIKEQIKQTTAGATTYVFQEKHRSTTAVSQLNYTVSANAVTVKIEFYLTNQFNNLFAVRDIGVLMDASTDIEARVPIAQLIENINNHPSTTRISGAKLRFTNDVTFDKSFHTKLFAETGFIENLSTYEFSADNIKTGTLEADHIKGGTLDFDLFHAKHFSADSLTSGTIDADIININNLSASRIKTGNLDVSSGLKITSGNHQIMSIDPETLNLEFNVNQMSIGGVKLISEDDQPQMEQNIATELEGKIKPYLHIAYANNATGTSGFSISDSLNKLYIGTYTNYTSTHSTDPSKYKWALIKGEKGTTGVGLQSITEWYLATPLKEGVTRTTSGWKESVQTLSNVNNYLWNYEQVNYDNGTKHYTEPTIIGTFGEQGISVKGVTEYYLASPLSEGITKDTPGWTTDIQPLTPENKYLWNKEVVHYSDDAAFLDKTEILSGTEIFTDKADEGAVVHVEIDGKSYQNAGSGKNLVTTSGGYSNDMSLSNTNWKMVAPSFWDVSFHNNFIRFEKLNTTGSSWVYIPLTESLDTNKIYTLSIKYRRTTSQSTALYISSGGTGSSVQLTTFSNTPNEWVTRTITFTPDLEGRNHLFFTSTHFTTVGETFDIEYVQIEEGSVATEYQPSAPTPDYPIEIHSLNDFDVVSSVGRENLQTGTTDIYTKSTYSSWGFYPYPNISLEEGKTINVRVFVKPISVPVGVQFVHFMKDGRIIESSISNHINPGEEGYVYDIDTVPAGVNNTRVQIRGRQKTDESVEVYFKKLKVEYAEEPSEWCISTNDIQYTEYSSTLHKTNLLLDEPLRSVGDVKDRLFRDTDGLWKIERNIGEIVLNGAENWTQGSDNLTDVFRYYSGSITLGNNSRNADIGICSHLQTHPTTTLNLDGAVFGMGNRHPYLYLNKTKYPTTTSVKNWILDESNKGTPVVLQFRLETPITEALPQPLQDKLNNLRTFKDSNYVYTVLPDKSNILPENLKPTLHATFKSKAWAGNFAGHPSIVGVYGDSAKLLYLSTSADSMTFNSDGSANPASQTITFTGNLQNVLGNVIFTAVAYNGTTVVSTISLSGVGNTRTLTQAQFPASADRVQVKATLGNLEDTVTIVKLKNGADAIVGYLTNESVTLSANNAGTVSSFGSASGTFKVFEGTIDRTSSATFRVKTQTGAVATINSSSGAYAVSSMSSDSANIVFEATYKNIKIDQTLSLSKSKEGVKGIPGPQGVSITKVDVQYYLSTSNDSLVGGGWSTTAPDWKDGRFMWSKTVTTYTSGSPTESKPVCITGAKGSTGGTGSTGATGRGISSIVEEFYLSNSKDTQTGGSWSTTMPTWSPGKYVWTRSLITYTTGTPPTSTTEPLVSSEWEAINQLEIGGRNYLLDSQYLQASGGASNHTFRVGDNGYIEINSTSGGGYISNLGFNKSQDLFNSNVEVGETYTVSFAVRSLDGSSSTIDYYDNNAFSYHNMEGEMSDKFSRFHITGVKRNNNLSMHMRFNSVGKFEIKEAKLEKGNKATDWSPAPEDIQKEIDDVSDITNTLKNFTDTAFVDGIIERAEAQAIKEHLNTLKKENNDLLNQYSTLYTNVNLISPAKDALLAARNNYATSYASLVSVINTAISGDRTTTAQKTAVDNGFVSYTNSLQAFTQRLSEAQTAIGAKVSSDAVGAIEIGGRNLVPNSKLIEHPIGRNNLLLISAGLPEGTYTISFDYEVDSIAVSLSSFLIYAGSSVTQVPLKLTGEKRAKQTFTITPARANIGLNIYFGSNASESPHNAGRFIELQIEKGNVATDWSPAPEDVTASIKAAQDKANAASQEAIAAQADATVGKNMADNLSNDSIITQVEKLELKREWDAIVKEKPSITIQATDYALQGSTEATAYNTAYNSLNGSIPTLLSKMNETSPVNRTTFNTNFANYYDKRQLLLNRIAKKAKELADVAQSSVDNLEIGGENLIVQATITRGKYLSASGAVATDAAWFYTDYIPVSNYKKMVTSGYTNLGNAPSVIYYNSSKVFVRGVNNKNQSLAKDITINSGEAFIRFSGTIADLPTIKLERGTKATSWSASPKDIEVAYTAVAQTKAEAERVKAEAYADNKVTDEEKARIADADAKLAAAKKYAVDQILADKTIKDTRNDNETPAWYYTNHPRRTIKEFKLTSVIGVVSSEGTYGILETEIPWNDASGGPIKQTFRVNSKTFKRSGTTTSWSSWISYDDIAETAKSDAATAKGIADGAASSASTANSLLADIASDSVLTPGEKKSTKKEWDIIVGEKPKIDASADTYSITTQKTAYNNAYNALNTYLTGSSGLLVNLNIKSAIVGTTFRNNFKNYYNARQDLLNAIADGAKSLVDNLEIGGRNYFYTSLAKSSGRNSITLEPNTQYIMSTNIPKRDDGGAHIFVGPEGFTASSDTTGAYAGKNISFTTTGTGIVEFHFSSFNPDWVTNGDYHIQLEKGNKATDWSPAPEDVAADVNKKTYNAVRYIRDWANGSTTNTSNHWYEIQAIDTLGNNIALGKTVRSNASASLFPVVTDGNTAGTYASGSGNMKAYMEVDLGSVYYNISEIKVWRYHNDGRTYYDTKTEVSEDGNNWYPIFDSKIEDEYSETSAGRTYPNTQAKSEGLLAAYHTTERLESATSKVVINGGNITAGRIQDSLKRNDLNLDNGTFKLANGNIEYDGTALKIKTGVQFAALPTDTQTKINAGAAAEANAKKYVDDNTGNLVNNPAATGNHAGWTGSGLSSLNQTFEGVSTRVLQTSTSTDVQYYSSYFKVDPSKAYEVSAWFKKSVANSSGYYFGLNGVNTGGSNVGFVQTTQAGGVTNANNTNFYFDSGTAPTNWVKVVGYIMPVGTNASDLKGVGTNLNAIMKQDIDRIRVRFLNWSNAGTTRQLWVANPKVVEVDPNAIITAAQAKTLTDTWVHPGTTQINGNNIRTGTLDAKIITTGTLSANNGTSTLNMSTGDMVMNGNFNLGAGALQWNKTSKTLSIKANSLKIGSYDAASKNDVEQAVDGIEIGGRNLVVLRDISNNTYISTNGTTAVATGHATTAYIEVLPNQDYVWSASNINQLRVAYYNSSKAYISTDFRGGDQGSVVRFKTSSNAAFIRVSAQSPSLNTWKIEKGSHPTDWTPSTDDVYQYVDDVEIGGTQLLDGTSNQYTYLNLGQWYTTIVGGDTKPFADYGLSIGDTITYRVYIKSTSGNGGIARLTIFEANGGYTTRIGSAIENGAEGYSTVTYTIESDRTRLSVGIQNSVNTGVSTSAINYKEPKLEKGVKATAWSMSQNDYQMIVDSVEVGGDNLLRIGEWASYPSYNTIPVVSHNGRRITFTKNNHNSIAISNARLPYGPNIYYVISGYAKIDDQPVTNATWGSYRSASTYQGSTTYFNVRDSDGYFVIVQNWTNSSQWLFHASNLMPSLNGTITIDDFMVQAGNKPSGWKLNPEDERIGGENLLYNSDFSKTAGGAAFTVGGIRYSTYPARWGGYNGGVNSATTNYHMHLDDNTFGYNVVEFNESNGTRHWKGGNISLDGLVKSPGFYTVSVDLYATGSETRLFGGFYYYKKGGTTMSFHAGQYSISPNVINNWKRYSVLHELPDDVDLNQNIRFYMYGYGFGTNSILYVRKIQLQEGTIASSWSLSTEDVEEMISLKADQSGTSTIIQSMQAALDIALQEKTAAALQNELSEFIKNYNKKQEAEAKEKVASEKRIKDIEGREVLTDTYYGDMVGVKTFIDRTFFEGEEGLMIKNGKEGTHILINDEEISFFSDGTKTAYISQNKLSISDGTFIENLQIGDISASNETSRSHLTFRYTPQK